MSFARIAIVNRAEPAMRLINAVREWNAEGRDPLTTIALYTAPDRGAMFVREADEAFRIGPENPAQLSSSPYLDYAELERALRATRADAVWPGWGFVSEKAEFAELCERLGITFVGPSGEVMRRLGDKIGSKLLAEQAGVPLAPWSGGPVADLDAAREHAERIGYPLMVKATAGGGGRGIRRVESPDALAEAFERAGSEGLKTAGDATVFLEKAISGGRHVEVQVVADGAGEVWALGVRDCSVQRRNQKVLEESASTALDAEQTELLRRSAIELARLAGYTNAGTVEFLYSPEQRLLTFLEVNTRLQVEHPVTESTTGVDIVKLQLHVAAGGKLSELELAPAGGPPSASGHAIEARLTAEDPERDFAPAPGRILHLALPSGPGVRVDTGVATGDVIPPQFDSMIAKIIAWGRDRAEARARLARALRQTTVAIEGGTTNKAFLLDLLDRPEVREGTADTTWLDTMMACGYAPPQRTDIALLATAVEAHAAHAGRQQARLFASAERGRPEVGHETWHQVDVRVGGSAYRLRVAQTRGNRYRVEVDGTGVDVDVERTGAFERRLTAGGRTFAVLVVPQGPDYLVEVDGAVHRVAGGEAGLVRAPAPAMVISLAVAEGEPVAAGDPVAIVESMKLETALRAPVAGVVREILVAPNTQVERGTKLVRIEPEGDGEAAGERADLSPLAAAALGQDDPAAVAADALAALRWQMLGFDLDEAETRPLLARLAAARSRLPDDEGAAAGEVAVLRIFADLCSLSRNRRGPDDPDSPVDESSHNPQEYLYAYLRTRDAEAAGLPATFTDRLSRALSHYGVPDPAPTAPAEVTRLHDALYRIFLAHRRAAAHVPAVLELLRWRLANPHSLSGQAREEYLATLDALVRATQLRHPVVGEAARQVRFRSFDSPAVEAARQVTRRQVRAMLDELAAHPDAPDRAERIEAVIAATEPILGLFGERHDAALLEVMTRRYYRIRPLEALELDDSGGTPVLTARYVHDNRPYTVLACLVADEQAALTATADRLRRQVEALPAGCTALLDVYLTCGQNANPAAACAERVREALAELPAGRLGRVAVAVREAAADDGRSPAWFTYRAGGPVAGLAEDRTLRGLHPLVAERLGLWRLDTFDLRRLPAATDVHLFHATGRTRTDDQRLIALADVRDLVVLRDDDGRIRSLPQLEHALDACLDGLRAARAAEPELAKLEWNRIKLYVWPALPVDPAELAAVARALAPRTEGLGLEQVMVQFRVLLPDGRPGPDQTLRIWRPPGAGLTLRLTAPPAEPLRELDAYDRNVMKARRRGAVYPYEIVPMLTAGIEGAEPGTFTEYDLDAYGEPVPVERAPGNNTASIVLGVLRTPAPRYPEGMTRVVLIGDPTKALGAIAEPECRRILAALELATRLEAPVEWFAVSAGAKIAMDSGTENMDWISRVLRGIVEFTQAGKEINVVVTGINVGAQPYWNAEATMLMHTKGILVMTPDSAMVLTGKTSLDYSGGVSAEDNFGIGGYDRIMGPNGQAQYWAPDLAGAIEILNAHYAHTYRAPGERFPRPAPTADPVDRDVTTAPHDGPGCTFTTLGEIFSAETNAERKKPFDIRSVLRGVADADLPPLERWVDMHDAESVVVLDAHLGGQPVALLGIESRPLPRRGPTPVDGPAEFTAGTLFPLSSRKTARAINAASGNRPLVVLANLSGFDGSPESLRRLQLEHGAEIGRAIVNFDGPIVFCVISRYHGGAFVVFSGTLNDNMEVAAVSGSYASVIGGAPAAAVAFAGEVNKRTAADPRLAGLDPGEAAALRPAVRSEHLRDVAQAFDAVHSIERAQEVGSVHRIVEAASLRPYLIDAVRRGMRRFTAPGA